MRDLEQIRARNIMSRNVITLDSEMSLREALEIFSDERISGAPVLDEQGELVGVVSVSDIVAYEIGRIRDRKPRRRAFRGFGDGHENDPFLDEEEPEEILDMARVESAMNPMAITAGPEASLVQVARIMSRERIHRVLITDGTKLVGVVSSMDVAKAISDPKPLTSPARG